MSDVKSIKIDDFPSENRNTIKMDNNDISQIDNIDEMDFEEESGFERALNSLDAAASTTTIVATKIISGIGRTVEKITDGLLYTGGKMADGLSSVIIEGVGVFNKDFANAMNQERLDMQKENKEIIAIDAIGSVENAYQNTDDFKVEDEKSLIKYNSEAANKIKDISESVSSIAASAVILTATGGAGAASFGFMYGSGSQAEKVYSETHNTGALQECGIVISGGLSALSWAANGKLVSSFIKNFGTSIANVGIKETGAHLIKSIASKDFIKSWLTASIKDPGNYISTAMMSADDVMGFINKDKELNAKNIAKFTGTVALNFGLNVLDDGIRKALGGFKAVRANDFTKDFLEKDKVNNLKKCIADAIDNDGAISYEKRQEFISLLDDMDEYDVKKLIIEDRYVLEILHPYLYEDSSNERIARYKAYLLDTACWENIGSDFFNKKLKVNKEEAQKVLDLCFEKINDYENFSDSFIMEIYEFAQKNDCVFDYSSMNKSLRKGFSGVDNQYKEFKKIFGGDFSDFYSTANKEYTLKGKLSRDVAINIISKDDALKIYELEDSFLDISKLTSSEKQQFLTDIGYDTLDKLLRYDSYAAKDLFKSCQQDDLDKKTFISFFNLSMNHIKEYDTSISLDYYEKFDDLAKSKGYEFDKIANYREKKRYKVLKELTEYEDYAINILDRYASNVVPKEKIESLKGNIIYHLETQIDNSLKNASGFADGTKSHIKIDSNDVNYLKSTLIHEMIHNLAWDNETGHTGFSGLSDGLNEGATEYLEAIVFGKKGYNGYTPITDRIEKLINAGVFTDVDFKAAYFSRNNDYIIDKLNIDDEEMHVLFDAFDRIANINTSSKSDDLQTISKIVNKIIFNHIINKII